jgi:hypothetical protein
MINGSHMNLYKDNRPPIAQLKKKRKKEGNDSSLIEKGNKWEKESRKKLADRTT